ncbi:hypothetical protein D3C87_1307350 [compost metagenome]
MKMHFPLKHLVIALLIPSMASAAVRSQSFVQILKPDDLEKHELTIKDQAIYADGNFLTNKLHDDSEGPKIHIWKKTK